MSVSSDMFLFTHLLLVFAQPHKGEETALLALHHREGGRQALEAARDAIYVDSTNPRYKKENTYVCLPSEFRSPPSIQQVISPLLIPAYLFRFDWIVCCSRYGQFLTAAETADLLAPDISAYNQVESWLSAGVSAAGNVKPNY